MTLAGLRMLTGLRPCMILGMESLVTLDTRHAGETLTLQRAAYVTEAQAHSDLDLPPLRQSLADLASELADPEVLALGLRDHALRLVAAVRVRVRAAAPTVAEVGRLTVAPDRQGQGLGSRLLADLEQRLSTDVAELRLFTGERSAGNLRLYSRLGYTETHRTPTPAGYALIHLAKLPYPSSESTVTELSPSSAMSARPARRVAAGRASTHTTPTSSQAADSAG